ncbi:hypothetical protein GJ496_002219 [Pomphorhynchus laevis]|nr:hypothetical protein GJ496_002219 [Pomphorhynchus laevis]
MRRFCSRTGLSRSLSPTLLLSQHGLGSGHCGVTHGFISIERIISMSAGEEMTTIEADNGDGRTKVENASGKKKRNVKLDVDENSDDNISLQVIEDNGDDVNTDSDEDDNEDDSDEEEVDNNEL